MHKNSFDVNGLDSNWALARDLFLQRRGKISKILGEDNEIEFLLAGTFQELQSEPVREPEVRFDFENSPYSYALPDQTLTQLHQSRCTRHRVKELGEWFPKSGKATVIPALSIGSPKKRPSQVS
jgi:hypothetical protein